MACFVRRLEGREVDSVKAIQRAIYPEYEDAAEDLPGFTRWRAASQLDAPPGSESRYVVLHQERDLSGYGALWPVRPRQFRIDLMVHPNRQRRGAGSLLLSRLISDARLRDAMTVQARARDDHREGFDFLSHRSFIETQRMFGLELSIAEFRASPWASATERLLASGIRIITLEMARREDEGWLGKLHALHNAALPDWPDPDPDPAGFTPIAFEKFRQRVDTEITRPDAFFVATTRDCWVGYCGILAIGTAVHPGYRGRGVATALKVEAILRARQEGMRKALTCTANPTMRAVNEKLGYRHVATEIRLVRYL
jgi:GNAT superfamily N-acetyltransferase